MLDPQGHEPEKETRGRWQVDVAVTTYDVWEGEAGSAAEARRLAGEQGGNSGTSLTDVETVDARRV